MQQITPREQILKNIRAASVNKNDEILQSTKKAEAKVSSQKISNEELEIQFAKELNYRGDEFIYCINQKELSISLIKLAKENNWTKIIASNKNLHEYLKALNLNPIEENVYDKNNIVYVTDCEFIIANTASVMLSSNISKNTKHNHLNDVILIIAERNQIEANLGSAIEKLKTRYKKIPSKINLITGPKTNNTKRFDPNIKKQKVNKVFVFLLE